MQDISLHILDILENAISAEAKKIELSINVNEKENILSIRIKDDGKGIDEELLQEVENPFYTTKKERIKKVGLGIPLFKQHALMTDGDFSLKSEKDAGTVINVVFQYDHIDRMPMGDLESTLLNTIFSHPEVDFEIILQRQNSHETKEKFSTSAIRRILGDVPLTYPDVMDFIKENIKRSLKKIKVEEL